jgi:hypothetical protein
MDDEDLCLPTPYHRIARALAIHFFMQGQADLAERGINNVARILQKRTMQIFTATLCQ